MKPQYFYAIVDKETEKVYINNIYRLKRNAYDGLECYSLEETHKIIKIKIEKV